MVAGGGGKMQATLGYILQAGPTEFADSLDAVSPRRPSSWIGAQVHSDL